MSNFLNVEEIYGSNCFSEIVMKEKLPKTIYKEMVKVQNGEIELSKETADVVATAMKDWAISKGATHFTHWFQPLTGYTAEKHDSFIDPDEDGSIMMEFSGKELIKGEPDASSFPNGGLRDTYEARGYTAWDVSSPAFLKEDKTGLTLCIPTAFFSYTGEALDKKVPLLKSMEAVSKASVKILKLLGTDVKKVTASVGPEQEYFLVDKEYFEKRPDLLLAGRTVFGGLPSKGQEMSDHYFGVIKDRVADFMRDLNHELWRLGISAKTQHNEVAPNQFELAPIYDSANVATDRNQLTMEAMKRIASRHGMVALMHEKPFAGVNGSGKHNNWSLATDTGVNLLSPGTNPQENTQFLLFLAAIIEAVDTYAPLLRMSAASAGNDHRLGGHEAPPAVISIYLGKELTTILEKIAKGEVIENKAGEKFEMGVNALPALPKDATDRNRTSPFAFTINKFEFRMVGSNQSIAGPNVVLNTSVAEILTKYTTRLEKASDVNAEVTAIVKDCYNNHNRIIFDGNGYGAEWIPEAEKRGLANLKTTVDSLPELAKDYSVELFTKHKVFTKAELEARVAIYSEAYSQQLNIEANLTSEMAIKHIVPAVTEYVSNLTNSVIDIKAVLPKADTTGQESLIGELSDGLSGILKTVKVLNEVKAKALTLEDNLLEQAKFYSTEVIKAMADVRAFGDKLETITDKELWPFPSYEDLLFKL
ncbi:glutamine synthetase type III [Thiospirochaeta perfilievii]|uniref:Glutamine synthetase type III n=1 Tax=Thiospirochaeta perfilievii TaxID=252967 RepID=A0A5C1QGX8_9SPIO|nr:glutamine synthetase III [Thiospirochaeta perfilievii]QEN05826.1 glutamine synthetase type III [Thiospirochaeta perfilievii]